MIVFVYLLNVKLIGVCNFNYILGLICSKEYDSYVLIFYSCLFI